ncbi:MAG: cytidine deaminase [Bdellovibrio sp.]
MILKARLASEHSYAPYSHCHVGAAVVFEDGRLSLGCNVENASYGATICAERSAVLGGIAAYGVRKLKEVAVVSNQAEAWPPCGMCLQVLAEFASPECRVYLAGKGSEILSTSLGELLPFSFSPRFLASK